MKPIRPARVSPTDDQAAGQMVIIIARWILVLAGLVLVLWNPSALGELRLKVLFLLVLAATNFYLCAQVLRRKRTLESVMYAASVADLGVISAIIASEGGFASSTYTFYFPAILALSLAVPGLVLSLFVGSTVMFYGLIGLITMPPTEGNLQTLLVRILMIVAVAAVGNQYWRMERSRQTGNPPAASPAPETAAQPS